MGDANLVGGGRGGVGAVREGPSEAEVVQLRPEGEWGNGHWVEGSAQAKAWT